MDIPAVIAPNALHMPRRVSTARITKSRTRLTIITHSIFRPSLVFEKNLILHYTILTRRMLPVRLYRFHNFLRAILIRRTPFSLQYIIYAYAQGMRTGRWKTFHKKAYHFHGENSTLFILYYFIYIAFTRRIIPIQSFRRASESNRTTRGLRLLLRK